MNLKIEKIVKQKKKKYRKYFRNDTPNVLVNFVNGFVPVDDAKIKESRRSQRI